MKNIFKVIAVVAVFVLGMQNTTAQTLSQDQDRPEVIAKQQTSDLHDALNLTGDQQRYIFRALTAKEVNYRKHVNGKDLNNPEVAANKKKFDDLLVKSMKNSLTEEQFATWLAMKH